MANSRLVSNADRFKEQRAAAIFAAARIAISSASAAAEGDLAAAATGIRGGSIKTIADLDTEIAAVGSPTSATIIAALGYTPLRPSLNLSDVASAPTARGNLGLGSAAPLDADADVTLAANSDVKIATQKAVKAFVAASIAALVNSAPGALDTLKELADALGDDANFAATVTTTLAGKQPLDADLTAIAALATSAFGRALLTLASASALTAALGFVAQLKTAAYTETAVSGELVAWCSLAGGFAVTLPAAAGNAAKLTFKNMRADGPITIAAAGSDTIDGNASIIVSAQYAAVTLMSDGVSAWGII